MGSASSDCPWTLEARAHACVSVTSEFQSIQYDALARRAGTVDCHWFWHKLQLQLHFAFAIATVCLPVSETLRCAEELQVRPKHDEMKVMDTFMV